MNEGTDLWNCQVRHAQLGEERKRVVGETIGFWHAVRTLRPQQGEALAGEYFRQSPVVGNINFLLFILFTFSSMSAATLLKSGKLLVDAVELHRPFVMRCRAGFPFKIIFTFIH